ncbi:MAG: DUF4384 domain-containing protein [Desulfobacteraceae bacterium]|nr:DUF4384 domain-containing protein [Desulfobacteraceae bacterium]
MGKRTTFIWAGIFFLFLLLSACVTTQKHVVGKGSSLSLASKSLAMRIQSKYDFTGQKIQIGANNFWEKDTRLNLPFSSALSETLAAELSLLGAEITVEETGENPLKAVGAYLIAGDDVLITVRLRQMGKEASTDIVVVEDRINKSSMDPKWLKPEFERIARSLVNLLEFDYHRQSFLKVIVSQFQPGTSSQPELVLGEELTKYIKEALAASSVFKETGDNPDQATAVLKGEYIQKGQRMEFHASIVDKGASKHYAGAKIPVSVQTIPNELLEPGLQSIDDLVEKVARLLLEKAKNKLDGKGHLAYIGQSNFFDDNQKAITQFGRRVAQKLKDVLSNTPVLSVTTDPTAGADLVLSGHYFKVSGTIVLSVDLEQFDATVEGCRKQSIASAQAKLASRFCGSSFFETDVKGYTDFLMFQLEKEAARKLPCFKQENIFIHKFKVENKRHYSKLSDYLNENFTDYFASSMYFSPVTNVADILTNSIARRKRILVPAENSDAAVASMVDAKFFISGSFWPEPDNDIKIQASLMNLKGDVLASEQVLIKNPGIDPAWLGQSEPSIFTLDQTSAALSVELFTQKGRHNLSFRQGEEILFFVRANKDVYIQVFTSDANQNVFRIYPNDFENPDLSFKAGHVAAIPNDQYASDFKFEVKGKTGNELVFAFASDSILPDLPGSDNLVYGMKQVNISPEKVIRWFSEYASKRGISLSWDSIPILTMP